jgi:hypothetical protein
MKNKIKSIAIGIMLFMSNIYANCQSPDWTVNADSYQHSMTIVGSVSINNVPSADVNDQLGVFVGAECRGVAHVVQNAGNGKYLVFLIIYSNTESEKLDFKLYDASTETIYTPESNLTFLSNSNYGTADDPFVIQNTVIENHAPVFISGNIFSVYEKNTFVTSLAAQDSDNDAFTFAISGGADQKLFTIANNQLQFVSAPVYSAPTDADANNEYLVDIQVSDGKGGVATQNISVKVIAQVDENASAMPTIVITRTSGLGSVSSAFNVTFTFSKIVSGFDLSDIIVINGVASNFKSISELAYTADVTPNVKSDVVVSVSASVVADAYGNKNSASNLLVVSYLPTSLDLSSNNDFKVYPNPSNGIFKVQVNEDGSDYWIEVCNLNGQILYRKSTQKSESIDFTGKKGYYIVSIKNEKTQKKIPLVVL